MERATRPSRDWTATNLADWLRLGVVERSDLEFKRSDASKKNDAARNELSKDVSAFANSEGGYVIYGVRELDDNTFELDGGIDPNEVSLESIEQVINSRIQPRISGVELWGIVDPSASRYYAIVKVPRSITAHQAFDRKYYRRFNLASEPMHDHEIRAAMDRGSGPIITPEFPFRRTNFVAASNLATYEMGLVLKNSGRRRTNDVRFELDFPGSCITQLNSFPGLSTQNLALSRSGRTQKRITLRIRENAIFPNDEARFEYLIQYQIGVEFYRWATSEGWCLQWRVFADDAPMREGVLPFRAWCDY